ncbi:MAG: hypothetical protein KDD92_17250 [Caldilineaceae bacterium]|nr:hypothetical protein [Caldilineaceae bacterium]
MLKAQLSLARSRPRDAETLRGMMVDMEGDVDRMTRLIEQMLTLTAIDQEQLPSLTPLDLTPLLQRLIAQLEPIAAAKGVVLQSDLDPAGVLLVMGNRDQLHQLFTNLLDNAVKYTFSRGTVTLTAVQSSRWVQVSVADSGIGIAPEHLPHLSDRFYRTDSAR